MKIDNIGFHDIEGIRKMSEQEFIQTYNDHRPHGMTEADWLTWMRDAYSMLVPKVMIGGGNFTQEIAEKVKKGKASK